MYSPAAYSISDPDVIRAFLRRNNFGTLISADGATFHDTPTPFLVSEDLTTLTGHIARANAQWRAWAVQPAVKVIFHGPHAYVSPRFYASEFNVPTWNYSAVSIEGRITILENRDSALAVIEDLVATHEGPAGWRLDRSDVRYMRLLEAVVCFSIRIDRVDAKFKLNQNKSPEDRASVIAHLRQSRDPLDRQTAELMQAQQ